MITVTKRDTAPVTRCVTLLKVKRAGASGFTFTGWATTPAEDLVGDIVEPRGAVYELPLPLLWMHDHHTPVGVVETATVTERGIRVSFRLLPEVEKAKEAVALIEAGALALSIGFIPLDDEPLRTGGRRYTRWRWNELSIVSVAANPTAKIDRIGKCLVSGAKAAKKPERLPAYVPSFDLVEDFKRAVATLPEATRKNVSEAHSIRTGRTWTMRDASGAEIATVAPTPVKQAQPAKTATTVSSTMNSNLERRIAKLEKRALPCDTEAFAELLGGLIAQAIKPYSAKIAALEQELEQKAWRYRGYWRDGEVYKMNDLCTDGGNLWIAMAETRERPGHQASSWHLAARKGKDA